jgi:hypothetical protein
MLQVSGEMDILIKTLAAYPVIDLESQFPTLEEIFLAYYQAIPSPVTAIKLAQ